MTAHPARHRQQGARGLIAAAILALAPAWATAGDAGRAAARAILAGTGFEPCLGEHFDPARYRAELASLGWTPVEPGARGAAVDRIADTFMNLPPEADEALTQAALAFWRDRIADRTLLARGGELLFLAGDAGEGGALRLSCHVASLGAARVDALIETAHRATGAGPVPLTVAVHDGPHHYQPFGGFTLSASRRQDHRAQPPVIRRGLLTTLILPPPSN